MADEQMTKPTGYQLDASVYLTSPDEEAGSIGYARVHNQWQLDSERSSRQHNSGRAFVRVARLRA